MQKATTENGDNQDDFGVYTENYKRLPQKLFFLQRKLYSKAKREPKFRFYSLYGHLSRMDVLDSALKQVSRNKGSPGIDGVTIEDINLSAESRKQFLCKLQEEIASKDYKVSPIKRVYIPKSNGKKRPLGIPTVKDRVVQTAICLIIEPIFEADFTEVSFGFRPKKSAHDALKRIKGNLDDGYNQIYDADLSSYFDTIPHSNLIKCLEQRISDGHLLKLLRKFLTAPINDNGDISKPDCGTPQGGIISPLLANLYLHWFEKSFYSPTGPGTWARAHLTRYADDFVIVARFIDHRIETWVSDKLEGRMGLKINQEKTSVINLNIEGESLDFLGFTFRRVIGKFGNGKFTVLTPSVKAVKESKRKIREVIFSNGWKRPIPELIGKVNEKLIGCSNYFHLGYHRKAFRDLTYDARSALIRNFKRRSQRAFKCPKGMSWYKLLHGKLGLVRL